MDYGRMDGRLSSSSSGQERASMRQQLLHVDEQMDTLTSLAQGTTSQQLAINQQGGSHSGLAPLALYSALDDIAARLRTIEDVYVSIRSRLDKVDHRTDDNERRLAELQDISAGAVHQTARITSLLGGRETPTRSSSPGMHGSPYASAGSRLAPHTQVTGTPLHLRVPLPVPDQLQTQLSTTVQQHASQIHKLIAGLDFLEAHIIRLDQVVDGMNQATMDTIRDAVAGNASEWSPRIAELGEAVAKLHGYLGKYDKRLGSTEAAVQLVSKQTSDALQRLSALEALPDQLIGDGSSGSMPSPLALRKQLHDLKAEVQAAQQRSAVMAPEHSQGQNSAMSGQVQWLMSQVPTLAAENAQLKQLLTSNTLQLQELRALVQGQQLQLEQGKSEQAATLDARLGGLGHQLDARTITLHQQVDDRLSSAIRGIDERVDRLGGQVQEQFSTAQTLIADAVSGLQYEVQVLASTFQGELEKGLVCLREQYQGLEMQQAGASDAQTALKDEVMKLHRELHLQVDNLHTAAEARIRSVLQQVDALQAGQEDACSSQLSLQTAFAQLQGQIASFEEALRTQSHSAQEQNAVVLDNYNACQAATCRIQSGVDTLNTAHEHFKGSTELMLERLETKASALECDVSKGNMALAAVQEAAADMSRTQAGMQAAVQDISKQMQDAQTRYEHRTEVLDSKLLHALIQAEAGVEQSAAAASALDALRSDVLVAAGQQGMLEQSLQEVQEQVEQVREVTSTRFAAIKETLEGMASAESVDLLRAEQDRLRQAAAKLVVDLTTLRVSLEEVDSHASMEVERAFAQLERMEQAVQQLTDAQTHELAAVQAQCKSSNAQLAQEVAYVQALLAREYVNRDQLGKIFAAREDMKRAVDELSCVFSSGTLGSKAQEAPSSHGDQHLEYHCFKQIDELDVQAALDALTAQQAQLAQQVQELMKNAFVQAIKPLSLECPPNSSLQVQMKGKQPSAAGLQAHGPVPATSFTDAAMETELSEAQNSSTTMSASIDEHLQLLHAAFAEAAEHTPVAIQLQVAELTADTAQALSTLQAKVEELQATVCSQAAPVERVAMHIHVHEQPQVHFVQEGQVNAAIGNGNEANTSAPADAANHGAAEQVTEQLAAQEDLARVVLDELAELSVRMDSLAGQVEALASLQAHVVQLQQGLSALAPAPSSSTAMQPGVKLILQVHDQADYNCNGTPVALSLRYTEAGQHEEEQDTLQAVSEQLLGLQGSVERLAAQQTQLQARHVSLIAWQEDQERRRQSTQDQMLHEVKQLLQEEGPREEVAYAVPEEVPIEAADTGAAHRQTVLAELQAIKADLGSITKDTTCMQASIQELAVMQAELANKQAILSAAHESQRTAVTAYIHHAAQADASIQTAAWQKGEENRALIQETLEALSADVLQMQGMLQEHGAQLAQVHSSNNIHELRKQLEALTQDVEAIQIAAELQAMQGQVQEGANGAVHVSRLPLTSDAPMDVASEFQAVLQRLTGVEDQLQASAVTSLPVALQSSGSTDASSAPRKEGTALTMAVMDHAVLPEKQQELVAVSSKVAMLESMVLQLQAALEASVLQSAPDSPASGSIGHGHFRGPKSSDGGASAGGQETNMCAHLETRVVELTKAMYAMRNRLVALQEYMDSTQAMVKELHTVSGSLLLRLDVLEDEGPGAAVHTGPGEVRPLARVQNALSKLEVEILELKGNNAKVKEAAAAAGAVTSRVGMLEEESSLVAAKVASLGSSMPMMASAVQALERRMAARVDGSCKALGRLLEDIHEVARIHAEDTKNPFKAIAAATNNPVVVALEKRMEALRGALEMAMAHWLEDLRQDRGTHGLLDSI